MKEFFTQEQRDMIEEAVGHEAELKYRVREGVILEVTGMCKIGRRFLYSDPDSFMAIQVVLPVDDHCTKEEMAKYVVSSVIGDITKILFETAFKK